MHAREREGAAVTHIARKFLKMAVMRYVDDLFAPERCVQMCVILLHVVAQCVCGVFAGKQPWSMLYSAWPG